MVRAALRKEISRLRASWERFLSAPIPTHTPARDDGGGERPSRHFDRSGAEWRNFTPLMTENPARALSSFRPKRSGVEKSHAPNDRKAGPIPVISTKALRSGEISPSDDAGGIEAGYLSAQSIIKASSICLPYRHAATLEMTKEPCLGPSKKRPSGAPA